MNIVFVTTGRDPKTGECVQLLELRFDDEEWNWYAREMSRHEGKDGSIGAEGGGRVLAEVFSKMTKKKEPRLIIDHVSEKEFRTLFKETANGKKR